MMIRKLKILLSQRYGKKIANSCKLIHDKDRLKCAVGTHTKSGAIQEDAYIRPVHNAFEACCLIKFYVQVGSSFLNIILLS